MAKNMFSSIRVTDAGRFQARYRPRTGGHITCTFDTEQEARDWLNALRTVLSAPCMNVEQLREMGQAHQ